MTEHIHTEPRCMICHPLTTRENDALAQIIAMKTLPVESIGEAVIQTAAILKTLAQGMELLIKQQAELMAEMRKRGSL